MANYYVNTKAQAISGDHEVHKDGCSKMPGVENRLYLGDYTNCKDAVKAAKKIYSTADGCYYCSKDCHSS